MTAGLCYMIICFPSVFMLLIPTLAARLQKDWGKIGESTVVNFITCVHCNLKNTFKSKLR